MASRGMSEFFLEKNTLFNGATTFSTKILIKMAVVKLTFYSSLLRKLVHYGPKRFVTFGSDLIKLFTDMPPVLGFLRELKGEAKYI
jgi:hypothetical protein